MTARAGTTSTAPEFNGGDSAPEAAGVSVVVSSYNHARFVARALRSIFSQTLRPAQLLVIDDGSRDDSARVIEEVLRECPFPCELIARENRGLSATLNEGLRRTRGEFFAYLGSDDVWLPDFLRERVKLLRASPAAVLAYGHAYSIDGDDRIIDNSADWARYVGGDARHMLLETLAPLSPTVLHRRERVEHHGWNEAARLEDYELYLRLSAEGEFAFDARVLSAWRWHGANASGDYEFMLREKLLAQQRAAPALGMSVRELKPYQQLARFRAAEELARSGHKLKALRLVLANGTASAASGSEMARMFARLAVPRRALAAARSRRTRANVERYGTLRV